MTVGPEDSRGAALHGGQCGLQHLGGVFVAHQPLQSHLLALLVHRQYGGLNVLGLEVLQFLCKPESAGRLQRRVHAPRGLGHTPERVHQMQHLPRAPETVDLRRHVGLWLAGQCVLELLPAHQERDPLDHRQRVRLIFDAPSAVSITEICRPRLGPVRPFPPGDWLCPRRNLHLRAPGPALASRGCSRGSRGRAVRLCVA